MTYLQIAFGIAILIFMSPAACQGQTIFADDFAYPDGALTTVGAASWSTIGSTTANPIQVSLQQVVLRPAASSEDITHLFAAATNGLLYFGIDFSVDDLGEPYGGTSSYFAHFRTTSNANVARLDIVQPLSTGDFSVSLNASSSSTEVGWNADLNFDTVYRAIVEYDLDGGNSRLWLDAASPSDPNVVSTGGTSGISLDEFALRQDGTGAVETIRIDNLSIGSSFASVAVPEASQFLCLSVIGTLCCLARIRWFCKPTDNPSDLHRRAGV